MPWCRRRCSYCDFYFEVGRADPRFAAVVAEELLARRGEAPEGPSRTLYFGGGTPSAVDDDSIARVIEAVRARAGLADDAEITLEANPEDLEVGRLARLRQAGVNRLSLGVQSFDDGVLSWLGRAHDGATAARVVEEALSSGFERVSVDLICGVPDEPDERLRTDIDRATTLGAGHVSAYLLTVEPTTPLVKLIKRGRRRNVDEERQADAYEALQELLPARGLLQYEISSFARPGHESRHNRLYWARGVYLGLGPGAHSMRLDDDGSVVRRHTLARAEEWLGAAGAAAFDEERLTPRESFAEAVAFGLRDLQLGVDVEALARRHHVQVPPALYAALDEAAARGHIAREDVVREDVVREQVGEHGEGQATNIDLTTVRQTPVRLTPLGARFADAVAREVLAAAALEA